jgi:putative transcriptional regulator
MGNNLAAMSLRGKLLIAGPTLGDPNFHRTVVLIAEHSDEGAMGVVLNRPSEAPVAEVVPRLADLVEPGAHVFAGGPVQPNAVVVLAEFDSPDDAGLLVTGNLGFVPADADHDALADRTRRARVYAGHAGWGPGQLDAEMEEEAWIVEDAALDDPFAEEPEGLWSAVLERKGGRWALVARMPEDPSVN